MLIAKSIRSYINILEHVNIVLLVHGDRLVAIAITRHLEVSASMSVLIRLGCTPLVSRINASTNGCPFIASGIANSMEIIYVATHHADDDCIAVLIFLSFASP